MQDQEMQWPPDSEAEARQDGRGQQDMRGHLKQQKELRWRVLPSLPCFSQPADTTSGGQPRVRAEFHPTVQAVQDSSRHCCLLSTTRDRHRLHGPAGITQTASILTC